MEYISSQLLEQFIFILWKIKYPDSDCKIRCTWTNSTFVCKNQPQKTTTKTVFKKKFWILQHKMQTTMQEVEAENS